MQRPWALAAILAATVAAEIAWDGPWRHYGLFAPVVAISLFICALIAHPRFEPGSPGRLLIEGSAQIVLLAGFASSLWCINLLSLAAAESSLYSTTQVLVLLMLHAALGVCLVREDYRLLQGAPSVWAIFGAVAGFAILCALIVAQVKWEQRLQAAAQSSDAGQALGAFQAMLSNPLLNRNIAATACSTLERVPVGAGVAETFRSVTAREQSGLWPSAQCTRKICQQFGFGESPEQRNSADRPMLAAYLGPDWETTCAAKLDHEPRNVRR